MDEHSLSGVGMIDDPNTFFWDLTAPNPPQGILVAAPKGYPNSGSVAGLVSHITTPIFSPHKNSEDAKK
jgi:predicted AlkP superfamily phosphohydrolase/phosphomutase